MIPLSEAEERGLAQRTLWRRRDEVKDGVLEAIDLYARMAAREPGAELVYLGRRGQETVAVYGPPVYGPPPRESS